MEMKSFPLNFNQDICLLFLVKTLMMDSPSKSRFIKIFDGDPGYYLEKMKEKCSLYGHVILDASSHWDGTLNELLEGVKLLAVHYSDKDSDKNQLRKFYMKNYPALERSIELVKVFHKNSSLSDLVMMVHNVNNTESDNTKEPIRIGDTLKDLAIIMAFCSYEGIAVNASASDQDSIYIAYMVECYLFSTGCRCSDILSGYSNAHLRKLISLNIFGEFGDAKDDIQTNITRLIVLSEAVTEEEINHCVTLLLKDRQLEVKDQVVIALRDAAGNAIRQRTALHVLAYAYLENQAKQAEMEKRFLSSLSSMKQTDKNQDMILKKELIQCKEALYTAQGKIETLSARLDHQTETVEENKRLIAEKDNEIKALKKELWEAEEALLQDETETSQDIELSDEEKEYKSKRKQIQEKLIKFATRVPIFMYLTDYRERSLKDVITQLEPGLFKKVTGLDVKDFELLVSLGVFNDALMNDAVYKFKRYEDASLEYSGINKHAGENIGLFDTVLSQDDYIAME